MLQMSGNYVKKMYSRFDMDDRSQKCRLPFSHPTPHGSSRNRSTYCVLVMIRYVENIDISYRIVEKNIEFFDISQY